MMELGASAVGVRLFLAVTGMISQVVASECRPILMRAAFIRSSEVIAENSPMFSSTLRGKPFAMITRWVVVITQRSSWLQASLRDACLEFGHFGGPEGEA